MVLLSVLAVLAATALGGWFLLFKDAHTKKPAYQAWSSGKREAGGVGELLWETTRPGGPPGVTGQSHGFWFTEEHLVKRGPDRVVAYDLDSGEEAWEFPLGEGIDQCASSEERSGDRVALLRASGDRECARLTVLDIARGEEVFTTELPAVGRHVPATGDVPVVFGDAVLVSSPAGGHALDIETGEPITDPPSPEAECFAYRYAAFEEVLLAKRVCRTQANDNSSSGTGGSLRAFGPDLEILWEWELPAAPSGEPSTLKQVLSADPLVVYVLQDGVYRLWAVDPADGGHTELDSREHGDIHDRTSEYAEPCMRELPGLRHCRRALVADGKVILERHPDRVDPSGMDAMTGYRTSTEWQNQLAAVDLATGEEVWRTERLEGRLLRTLTVADGRVLAFQPSTRHRVPAMVVAIDPATGEDSAALPVTEDEEYARWTAGGDHRPVWHDSRLYLLNHLVTAETIGRPETLVFGIRD